MKIAVFGGSGFIGTHLRARLSRIADVLNVDPRENPTETNAGERFDPSNAKALVGKIAGFDVAIYAAGAAVPAISKHNLRIEAELNVLPAISTFQSISEAGVKRILFLSSGGAIYDPLARPPFDETMPLAPKTAYGVGKQTCETWLGFLHRTTGIDVTIVRPSNPYGPGQDPLGKQGVIPIWIKQILQEEEIALFGSEVSKDFLYISDLVTAIEKLVLAEIRWGIFNVGSGIESKLVDVLAIVERALSKKARVILKPQRDIDNARTALCWDGIRKAVGWTPTVSLEVGVQFTAEHLKSRLRL